jgi:hypothetical protein
MAPELTPASAEGPLTAAELATLEATLLPALERHHLRLLAHGLRTLQAIAAPLPPGQRPDSDAIRAWAQRQAPIADDASFQAALTAQLEATGLQLEQLAAELDRAPLALTLEELAAWATRQADRRLAQGDNATSP